MLMHAWCDSLLAAAFVAACVRARRLPAGAWLTALLGVGLFLPVVLWNARHDWAGFAFQLNHGLGGQGGWRTLGEFLAGQLALDEPNFAKLKSPGSIATEYSQFTDKERKLLEILFGDAQSAVEAYQVFKNTKSQVV